MILCSDRCTGGTQGHGVVDVGKTSRHTESTREMPRCAFPRIRLLVLPRQREAKHGTDSRF
ncbi:hypothetical protein EXIGLDRAFT_174921 [Exidia glandulosa HHB12029]|uniref:Uncharacterized protein n=1 Tax=Exidia glandulosa HHB12029 TaxID=1314781 RepID=A0A165F6T6_EXIGL|nr:hypothetical protein EXIGLDRAFT_495640 [Exidia glandulosa HHB12029]KZV88484.1 hypothetical protein EXIGLDRAFT_174921 [Exidia glandulosa HHB12029]